MADPTLQQALNFTDEDLVANRAGHLGPTQQGRLTQTKGRSQVMNLVSGAVVIVIIVVIAAYVLPMYENVGAGAGSSITPTPIIIAVLIGTALIIALSIWRGRRKLSRMDGAVLMTEGTASAREGLAPVSGGAMLPIYRLSIGTVTFPLASPEPMRAFTNGKFYRGYYVRGTQPMLVSAEAVEATDGPVSG